MLFITISVHHEQIAAALPTFAGHVLGGDTTWPGSGAATLSRAWAMLSSGR